MLILYFLLVEVLVRYCTSAVGFPGETPYHV